MTTTILSLLTTLITTYRDHYNMLLRGHIATFLNYSIIEGRLALLMLPTTLRLVPLAPPTCHACSSAVLLLIWYCRSPTTFKRK